MIPPKKEARKKKSWVHFKVWGSLIAYTTHGVDKDLGWMFSLFSFKIPTFLYFLFLFLLFFSSLFDHGNMHRESTLYRRGGGGVTLFLVLFLGWYNEIADGKMV